MPARAIPRPIRSFTALREPSAIMSAASVYPNGVIYFRKDAGSAIFAMMFMKYSSSASPRPMPNPFPLMCNVGNCPTCLFVLSWQLFKIVLGFTPRRRPWKACPSQNDDFLPRFGIYPPPDSPPGHINPKTIWNNAIPAPLWHFRVVFVALFALFSPPGFPDVQR